MWSHLHCAPRRARVCTRDVLIMNGPKMLLLTCDQWRTEGGVGVFKPPPEIPKALQNRAKLNPIVKTVKNR